MKSHAEIIPADGGGIAILSPYNPDFVAALKAEIPANSRRWEGAKKVWEIEAAEAGDAIAVAARFYSLLDRRALSATQVENAKIEAEMAEILANQQYIKSHTAAISAIIDGLDETIKGYSYTSKSAVKYDLAQDRALLAHALRNAEQPLESLAEVQVRGLAAAVRRLSTGNFPRNWPHSMYEAWRSI